MGYQNSNWTEQFSNLPEGWDIDPAIFERVLQERVFHCEGRNCSINGKALVRGEGMLKFVKLTGTRAMMEDDEVTPKRDPKDGEPLFEREDLERKVLCDHHVRLEEMKRDELVKNLPAELRNRGDKLEVRISTLFQNLSWVRELTKKAKRPERVAKFFLSLIKGAGLEAGIALDCIRKFDPATVKDDKKPHNFLVRGGEILGLISWDDVVTYHGVRHQNKNAFVDANLFLYSDTLAWVEERLVEWRKNADERATRMAAREAEAVERLATAKTLKQEDLDGVKNSVAELLAFFVGAAIPATESSTGGDDGRKGHSAGKPKQRRSAPPPAARQIDEQLDAGGRANPFDTPDVIVDDQAGSSKPTHAVALGDRPEISQVLAAVRAAIDPTK